MLKQFLGRCIHGHSLIYYVFCKHSSGFTLYFHLKGEKQKEKEEWLKKDLFVFVNGNNITAHVIVYLLTEKKEEY